MLAFDNLAEDNLDPATLAKRHQKVASYTASIRAKATVGHHFVPYIVSAQLKGPFKTSPWAMDAGHDNDNGQDFDLDWLAPCLRQQYENAHTSTLVSSTTLAHVMSTKSNPSKKSSRHGSRHSQKTANDISDASKLSGKRNANQPSQENPNSWTCLVKEIATPTSSQGKSEIPWSCGFVASSLPLQELDITMDT